MTVCIEMVYRKKELRRDNTRMIKKARLKMLRTPIAAIHNKPEKVIIMNNQIITKFKLAYPSKKLQQPIVTGLTFAQAQPIAELIKGTVIKFDKIEVSA